MAKITRRNLLAKTGAGAAAVGVLAAGPAIIAGQRHHSGSTSALKTAPPKSVPSVAYVRDAAKGEVVLMVGSKEIVRHDPELVAYLGRCCDSATV